RRCLVLSRGESEFGVEQYRFENISEGERKEFLELQVRVGEDVLSLLVMHASVVGRKRSEKRTVEARWRAIADHIDDDARRRRVGGIGHGRRVLHAVGEKQDVPR